MSQAIHIVDTPAGEGYISERRVFVGCQFQLAVPELVPAPHTHPDLSDDEESQADPPRFYQVAFDEFLIGLRMRGLVDRAHQLEIMRLKPSFIYFPAECARRL